MQRHLLLAGLLAVAASTPALAAKDKFNRAALGADWTVTAGSLSISGNALVGTDLSLGEFLPAANSNQAAVVVTLNGTGTQYGAIALGDIGAGNNAFIKIQTQNGAGTFSHGGFYIGNNSGVSFFALDGLPASSKARLTARLVGSVATMEIDTNLDGTADAVYTFDYGTAYGKGAGLGTYGPVSLDNLKTSKVVASQGGKARTVTPSGEADLSQ